MTPFKGTNRITSPYGWRTYTNAAGKTIREHHNGIDVVPTRYPGESITDDAWDFREVTGGKVVAVSTGWNAGRGTLIKVQTAPGAIEFYQHCAAVYVKVGQQVPQGTVLGRAGATGNVTGAHLHFEVQVNGSPVEPSAWLGLPNADGTYTGNDTLDKPAETEPADEPEQPPVAAQLQTLCILDAGGDIVAKAQALGLPVRPVQGYEIGPASSGDAMTLWGMAQAAGKPYYASYTEE